jgi:ABC-type oligopeptide transport system substrate-binding subunit
MSPNPHEEELLKNFPPEQARKILKKAVTILQEIEKSPEIEQLSANSVIKIVKAAREAIEEFLTRCS